MLCIELCQSFPRKSQRRVTLTSTNVQKTDDGLGGQVSLSREAQSLDQARFWSGSQRRALKDLLCSCSLKHGVGQLSLGGFLKEF